MEKFATPQKNTRYAYVASLWGANPGYVLGALVLGQAIRRRGSKHDLVLMHTDELPVSSRRFLSQVWTLRKVEYIAADKHLFQVMGTRFDGVFTKLHALGLVEYTKVLMLDLDLAVLQNVDDLFELPAPAAMHRGGTSLPHGTRIDGRHWFAGEFLHPDSDAYNWGQHGGINAGVMLLEPNLELHQRTLQEVSLKLHPERIPGAGPEQDYLSRLFAPFWTHINVKYNYQLHHVFFALEALLEHIKSGEADNWTPERLQLETQDIRIVHFSGEMKMWDRVHFNNESDAIFAEAVLRDCSPDKVRLWIDRAGEDWEYLREGLRPGSNLCCTSNDVSVESALELGIKRVQSAAEQAARQWREDFESLPTTFPHWPALPELIRQLHEPEWPADATFQRGARVELYHRDEEWFPGTVVAMHEDGTFTVAYDDTGHWGTAARFVEASRLRLLSTDESHADKCDHSDAHTLRHFPQAPSLPDVHTLRHFLKHLLTLLLGYLGLVFRGRIQHSWGEWFTRRAERYPEVLEKWKPKYKFESYEWKPGRASGYMGQWAAECAFGPKGWSLMQCEGWFPSEDKCASELDPDFLRKFLSSRTSLNRKDHDFYGKPLSEMFTDPEQRAEGWVYHARKFCPIQQSAIEEKSKTWQTGFHATRFACVYNILCVGLQTGIDKKKNMVYHFESLKRGCYYHRYQLFADGTAWCIVWHILADPSVTHSCGSKRPQRATSQEGVEIIGAYTRGFTYEQLEAFMKLPGHTRPSFSLTSQWQPELEHPVQYVG